MQGLSIAYLMAKAALNQMTVTLAQEYKDAADDIVILALDPGFIPTPTTGFKGTDDMDERVGPEETGNFFDWTGEELPF